MGKSGILKKYIVTLCFILGIVSVTSCAMQEVTATKEKSGQAQEKTYLIDIAFEGGSGKAFIESPVEVTDKDGNLTARFIWSSKNYDYMIVDGIRYDNENEGGQSTFTVPVKDITGELTVIGDTVAMSTPHEIEYLISWGEKKETSKETKTDINTDKNAVGQALERAGLHKTGSVTLKYASCFEIDKYGDFYYVSIPNSGDYLVVPKDQEVPGNIPENVTVLKKPLDKTYLVSTSAMDLINTCGALDMIKLSGTKESDWYIPEAKDAMERGDIIYAGRYRAPDYEVILKSGCNIAIENTMIYHEPGALDKLKELGIPVLVETSSYEEHPLGRLEWIKLYGVLFDRLEEANRYFEEQLLAAEPIMTTQEDTGKKVAFFHVTAGGQINVRKSGDYITRMIELSGGNYVPANAGDGESALSTMNMQMEDFYAAALDADIIIYNSTIGGEIGSVDELIGKNELFADFRAVKEGNVYCTQRNLFQQITGMAQFMQDLSDICKGNVRDYTYLNKLE